ncbi:Gfo/Idh/MocA family protein [Lutimonas sp.]|uniref:Gfo/Idh/MocA family protein n=1 Tax=Lutimonas sp. TaxID=1872403 RepID=UPI003D9BB265
MSKKATVRWGIIGCGDVTELKSGPAYNLIEGFELVAVMRRNILKAEDYAKRHHIRKFYGDAEALINDPEIDAVYIATPPDTHAFYAMKVARAKKPCCIEKPMAPSYQECLDICSAFEEQNLPLFVAYYRRSLPKFDKVKVWLKEGRIGEIRSIHWTLQKPPSKIDLSGDYNWRTDVNVAPGGYFDDLASHGLDLFSYYLGTIRSAQGVSSNQQGLYSGLDNVSASWMHENGVSGTGSWNFGTFKKEDKVTITGSKGRIEFSIFENDPLVLETDAGRDTWNIEHPTHVQLHHVQFMRDQLFNKDFIHPSTGKTALHTSWVMDKILGKIK